MSDEDDLAASGDASGVAYEQVYVPVKVRRAQEQQRRAGKRPREAEGSSAEAAPPPVPLGPAAPLTLLEEAMQRGGGEQDASALQASAEAELLQQVMAGKASGVLASAKEISEGVRYTESVRTDWRPLAQHRRLTREEADALRKKWHILVEGEDVPPPLASFADMRFPPAVLAGLAAKAIARPTPIQAQGLPCALSGRDMIGIAFTGSGKTVAFSLPLIMRALQEEMRMPLARGEGPIGIIMAPARDLAKQHAETLAHFAFHAAAGGLPQLRVATIIGGEDLRAQLAPFDSGCHCVVATPGRLKEHLTKRRFSLALCSYIVLDEGDRMLDMGFDEDIKLIFSFFSAQRQTIIYSATMPKKIQDFAREALVRPCVVNVGRAGAANQDIIQEVEYVKVEERMRELTTALAKTAPPALIFAENKRDVDEVHEYLLLKGVLAASVHGDKAQEERNEAIRGFKAGEKDVLVATDVAAKGMDFADIQHVINFDMPKDIETYIHRIGRTGRSGKTGVATTFIGKSTDENVLLDLKGVLIEAKQRIPPLLQALVGAAPPRAAGAGGGAEGEGGSCPICGGLGHRITECPKLERERRELAGQTRSFLRTGGGGEW
jgi:ATP-dependent RNA helicase DDX41